LEPRKKRTGLWKSEGGIAFPILLSAIDAAEEEKLLNLDRAVDSGHYCDPAAHCRLDVGPLDELA
jgi:hypothetical protein